MDRLWGTAERAWRDARHAARVALSYLSVGVDTMRVGALRRRSREAAHAEITAHLDAGLNPRAHNNSALVLACERCYIDIFDRLIGLGLTAGDARARFASKMDCAHGHPEVNALIAKISSRGRSRGKSRENDYLSASACGQCYLDVFDRLIGLGLTADDVRASRCGALWLSCTHGHLAAVERLIGLGLTADDARGCGALQGACEFGYLDVVERLLALGLTADDARANDSEALHMACARGHLAIVDRLISLGLTAGDTRSGIHANRTLFAACQGGHLGVVNRLIELGLGLADIPVYALTEAGVLSHAEVVARLIEVGAEPTPQALRSLSAGVRAGVLAGVLARVDVRRAIEPWLDTPELDDAAVG